MLYIKTIKTILYNTMTETTPSRCTILIFALLFIILVVVVVPQKPNIDLARIEKDRMAGGQLPPVMVQL